MYMSACGDSFEPFQAVKFGSYWPASRDLAGFRSGVSLAGPPADCGLSAMNAYPQRDYSTNRAQTSKLTGPAASLRGAGVATARRNAPQFDIRLARGPQGRRRGRHDMTLADIIRISTPRTSSFWRCRTTPWAARRETRQRPRRSGCCLDFTARTLAAAHRAGHRPSSASPLHYSPMRSVAETDPLFYAGGGGASRWPVQPHTNWEWQAAG